MRLFLDTHVLLWWLRDNAKLGPRTKALIAEPHSVLLVSVASFWELSIKARTGKIAVSSSVLWGEAQDSGFEIVPVRLPHLAALEAIKSTSRHNDPFDHLILAQTVAEEAMLITSDRQLLAYDVRAFRAK